MISPPTIPPPPPVVQRPADERQIVTMIRWLLILAFVVIGWMVVRYAALVLAPVLAALGIAYLLTPVIDRLVKAGLPRSVAALSILIIFIGLAIALITAFAPLVAHQIDRFVTDFPRMIDNLTHWLESSLGIDVPDDWTEYLKHDALSGLTDTGPVRDVASAALGGVVSVLGVLAEMLLVPVFAFYFLVDWPNLTRRIIHIIPPRRRSRVLDLLHEVDGVVSGWVRGAATVTAILAVLYAIAFSVIGMPLAIPIGLLVGVLTIIPFVGTMVGAVIALGVTLASGMPLASVGEVAATFGVLHILEAGVLTPKIVGHRVGLSESAALFAVVAGGKLLGFVGILLAVPIAATVAVLIRQLVKYYEHTDFFGKEDDAIVPVTPGMAVVMLDTGPSSALSPPSPDPIGLIPTGEPDPPELEPEPEPPAPDPEEKP